MKKDNINHPNHYTGHPSGIECIEVTQYMGFCLGNALKYIWRDGQKAGEDVNDDLRKAIWYIQCEIDRRIDEMELEKEVPQTDATLNPSFEYLKRKADGGDAEAQWLLGNAYLFGRGVEKNKEEAHRLWKLSQQTRFGKDAQ